MSDVKLVLTDLDGTLVLPESNTVSPAVIAAIKQAEQRGVKFVAVTGRPAWMAKDLLRLLGFQDPCIFEGGALIMNPATEEILWSKTVPTETVRRAVQILAPHALFIKYDVDVVKGGDATAAAVTKPALSVWASVPVDQASSLAEDLARLPEVAVHLNASPGGDFSLMGIQITHFQADKEHAVGELARLLGIDKAHTMAVGDGDNDLPLFRSAKIKVAVGNASEKLKAAADHVVADVQHDGFAAAVNTFVSGKSR